MAVTNQAGGVIKFTAAADAHTGNVMINKIRWVGPSTAAHICLVKNTAGKELFQAVADTTKADAEVNFPGGLHAKGLVITTLGSGTLYVYG